MILSSLPQHLTIQNLMPISINIKFNQEENFKESFGWYQQTLNVIYRKTSNFVNFMFSLQL